MQANPTINIQFSEISEVKKRLQELREEALSWHHIADQKDKEITKLQSQIRQKDIEIASLRQRITDLSIENVKLLNKSAKDTLRQYDEPTNAFSDK